MGKNQMHIIITLSIVLLYGMISSAADGVTVEILGKSIKNIPYVMEKGELLVAARPLIEEFGGTVDWNGTIKVLTACFDDGLEIRMQVGNKGVTLQPGNQFKEFTVPPCQIKGTTMISAQFFAHQFGYFYKWDESRKLAQIYKPTNWVQGMTFEEGLQGEVLTISSTKKVSYRSYILSEPDRLVIDLNNSALSVKATGIQREHYAFKNIKIAQNNAETVRVVVYLNHPIQYKIMETEGDSGFQVKVVFAAGIREMALTEQGILVRSTGEIGTYKVMEYPDPERLVIDIPDQTLQVLKTTIPINHPQIQQIRVSQHSWEPKVVRLVLDLTEKIEYNILRGKTANQIIIQPKSMATSSTGTTNTGANSPVVLPGNDTDATQTGTSPSESNNPGEETPSIAKGMQGEVILGTVGNTYGDRELIRIGMTEGLNQKIFVHTSTPATYKSWYLPNPDRLVIDVENVTTRLPAKMDGDDSNLLAVRVHQYPEKVRVVFDLSLYKDHTVYSDKRTQKIEIGLGKSPLLGKLIAIDPGHGGPDPGAIGPAGSHEKNFNLAMAQQLEILLQSAGAEVVMTREGDEYPTLSERVGIANLLNTDIFVSIHCNSHSRIDPGGTETFVSPDRQDSVQLAKAVQSSLVKAIGLFNRGVKTNEFHVLVNTTMPAILVEVAFISKTDEEKLLMSPEFQQKAAQGIFEGIQAYFTKLAEDSTEGQ